MVLLARQRGPCCVTVTLMTSEGRTSVESKSNRS